VARPGQDCSNKAALGKMAFTTPGFGLRSSSNSFAVT
jgi:hypothetical protein